MLKIKIVYLFIIINIAIMPLFAVRAAEVRDIIFPLASGYDYNFTDTYGAARSGGRFHEGTDIISAKMTPVVAVVDGRVTELVDRDEGWGLAIYIEDIDGYSYRYLHINNDTPGTDDGASVRSYAFPDNIQKGSVVTAGQLIAWVGDSGNAENVGSHLHFEIWTPDRQSINSYPSLMAALAKPVIADSGTVFVYQFTKDLEFGDEDASVKELQKYLNKNGFVVAASGAGSSGQETNYFGSATRAALIKFQQAKNISPALGYFGPKSRSVVNATNVVSTTPNTPTPVETQNSNGIVTAGWLVKDKSSAKVYYVAKNLELQWIVNEDAALRNFGSTWYLQVKTFDHLLDLGLSFGDYIL